MSHFRVQYAAGLLVCTLVACLLRRWPHAGLWMVLALTNTAIVLPLYRGVEASVVDDVQRHTGVALNVNTHFGDPVAVGQYLAAANADVVLLQEVSAAWLTAMSPVLSPYPYRLEAPRDDNFGIALYSRFALTNQVAAASPVLGMPVILATLVLDAGLVDVIGVHTVPPKSKNYAEARNRHFAQIASQVDTSRATLVMGDFNVSPWSPYFRDLIRDSGLRDSMQGFGIQPSWHTMTSWVRIPIDHVLVSDHITVLDRQIGPHVGSDHFPVEFEFGLKKQP